MQPVFAHDPLLASALIVTVLIWVMLEAGLQIGHRRRLRSGPQVPNQDKGSRLLLEVLLRLGMISCLLIAFAVPAASITSGRELLFWVGVLMVYAGLALRSYAINLLGVYFTTTLAFASNQPLIEAGPYRLIRHPSYTGLLLILLGFGLTCTNWLSLLVLMGSALAGLSYRIHVEEHVLQEHLGQRYREYMRRTKRLIPYIV